MKKKSLIIFSLLFIISFNIISFAEGWETQNGETRFKRNGSYVMGEILHYDGHSYILDTNGYLEKNCWVDLANNTYYATSDGSLYCDGKFLIDDHYYYFDRDCVRLKGWIDDNYYANDEGYLVNGFQNLVYPNDWHVEDHDKNAERRGWFYFDSTYKKVAARDDAYLAKSISGSTYCFDQNGIIRTGWRQVKDQTPVMRGYMYFVPEETSKFKYGEAVKSSWYSIEPPTEVTGNDEVRYFYFNSSGQLKVAPEGTYVKGRIESKTFLFNQYGYCVYGIRKVGDDYYYFGNNSKDCSMKTGKFNLQNGSEAIEYYFNPNEDGKGYSGVYNNKLYYKGRLQKADSYSKYVAYKVGRAIYLVNTSGTVVKNLKKKKDGNGAAWSTDSSGIVTYTDEGETQQPEAPEVTDD